MIFLIQCWHTFTGLVEQAELKEMEVQSLYSLTKINLLLDHWLTYWKFLDVQFLSGFAKWRKLIERLLKNYKNTQQKDFPSDIHQRKTKDGINSLKNWRKTGKSLRLNRLRKITIKWKLNKPMMMMDGFKYKMKINNDFYIILLWDKTVNW